jgi:hypothetical protein
MVDDAMKQQRPVLHQPEHGVSPFVFWAHVPIRKTGTRWPDHAPKTP